MNCQHENDFTDGTAYCQECGKKREPKETAERIPRAVIDAILAAFPNDSPAILKRLRFAGDHYSFDYAGMYVGVEFDGYIHT